MKKLQPTTWIRKFLRNACDRLRQPQGAGNLKVAFSDGRTADWKPREDMTGLEAARFAELLYHDRRGRPLHWDDWKDLERHLRSDQ